MRIKKGKLCGKFKKEKYSGVPQKSLGFGNHFKKGQKYAIKYIEVISKRL